jgi:hypothetical protein
LNGGNITITTGGSTPAGHADTWVKWDGDTEWTPVSIEGSIYGDSTDSLPTTQILNIENVVALEIGTDVTSIDELAFINCSRLTSVTIPNSVTNIGASAFRDCSGLTSVTIPERVESIGWRPFYNCYGLTSVTFEGKDRATVQGMTNYPFGLNHANREGVTIHCTDDDISVSFIV